MCALERPFTAANKFLLAKMIAEEEPDWELIPQRYNDIVGLIKEMLKKEPAYRPSAEKIATRMIKLYNTGVLGKPHFTAEIDVTRTAVFSSQDYILGDDDTMWYDRDSDSID